MHRLRLSALSSKLRVFLHVSLLCFSPTAQSHHHHCFELHGCGTRFVHAGQVHCTRLRVVRPSVTSSWKLKKDTVATLRNKMQLFTGLPVIIAATAALATTTLAAPAGDEVTSLPGWEGALPSKQYSGFLTSSSNHLHYIFVESSGTAPEKAPVRNQ